MQSNFSDIIYTKYNGRAKIIINRPRVLNAFTNNTLHEILIALKDAWTDREVGVIILTGAGDRAFSTGGDQTVSRTLTWDTNRLGDLTELPMHDLFAQILHMIRTIPKPVIAAVNGFAIGGGHVLHLVCDLTIATSTAKFGQVGPKVGSFDAGFGSAYLARIVGEKRAREMWYLCKKYSADECYRMGLVNEVVSPENLEKATEEMCDTLLSHSPTALAALKMSFNADSASVCGVQSMAGVALGMYFNTEEALEGRKAFLEKRPPDYSSYR